MTPSNWVAIATGIVILAIVILAIRKLTTRPAATSQVTSAPAPVLDALAKVILHYNNMQSQFANGAATWTLPAKGVIIHKITPAQAQVLSTVITAAVAEFHLMKLTLVLALMASESILDPECQNGNMGPGESNEGNVKGTWGWDMGACQLKLADINSPDLVGAAGSPERAQSALAFALDPAKAVPYMCGILSDHITWAQSILANTHPSNLDPRLNNQYMLGALAYKRGQTGALTLYQAGTWPEELNNFVSLESWFAQQLRAQSMFATS